MTDKQTVHVTDFIDTHHFGSRPHIRGRRIPVATIAAWHRDHHWNVATLADQFDLTPDQVQAALDYYAAHQTEIDQQEAALDEEYGHYGE